MASPAHVPGAVFQAPPADIPGQRRAVEVAPGAPGYRAPFLQHGDVTITLEYVTPEMALTWVTDLNTHNRNSVKGSVQAHSRDMESGDWLFVGDTIRFAVGPDGKPYLADGQHRLLAIIESGEPQWYIVVRGLDDEAQSVIDTGRVRTFAHTLSLERVKDGEEPWTDVNRLGAIVRRAFMFYKLGRLPRSNGGSRNPTKSELLHYLTENAPLFREALTVAQAAANASPKLGKSATMIGAAYFVLASKDKAAADIFFKEMLIKGFGLDDEHPVFLLRGRYAREGVYAISDDEAFMFTLKTWNHWRKNERFTKLQGHQSGWPSDVREYPIF